MGERLSTYESAIKIINLTGPIDDGRNYNVEFEPDGIVRIYGYTIFNAVGIWRYDHTTKEIVFSNFDDLADVFNGTYHVSHHWLGAISLHSTTTIINLDYL